MRPIKNEKAFISGGVASMLLRRERTAILFLHKLLIIIAILND